MLKLKKIIIGLALISLPFKASSNSEIKPANVIFDVGEVLVTPSYKRSLDHMKLTNVMLFAATSPINFYRMVAQGKKELFNVLKSIEGIDSHIEGATYRGEPLPPALCAHQTKEHSWEILLQKAKETIDKQNFSESERRTFHAMAEITFHPDINASVMDLIPEGFALVDECIQAGHEVYIISNYNGEAFDKLVGLHSQAFAKFKEKNIFISGKKGVAKPDPAIYEKFKQEMNIDTSKTTIFIDDQIENRPKAETGIRFIHHKKHAKTRDELVKLGLLQPLENSSKKKIASTTAVTIAVAACGVGLYQLLYGKKTHQHPIPSAS
jgi:FMN phosphatase YigB (HAD superfamily)